MNGVSVCVTTYRRTELLLECIRSVFENDCRPIEIVVSDNDFTEASASAVRSLTPPEGITIRHAANPGPSIPSENTMNAFREASHERVVLMHDDDFMVPGGIDALVAGWDRYSAPGECGVDAVIGRHYTTRADGTVDVKESEYRDAKFFRHTGFGPQPSNLWSALAQQFPCNGMMLRRSLAVQVGYPRETEVGRDPNDLHFGIRYALASSHPFVLIDHFVSAYRLSEESLLRSSYESRVYDGHLGYALLEQLPTRTPQEQEAKEVAMGRAAPLAIAGYLKTGNPRAAREVFLRNHRRMEKNVVAKLGLLTLIGLDYLGFSTIDRHSVRIRKIYDYFYHPKP